MTKDFIPHPVIHSDSKNTFVPDKHQSPIEKASKDMSDKGYEEGYLADAIRTKMKREFRSLWIVRINAFVREKDMTYSSFIKRLKNSRVAINRKMLAQIAVLDTKCFDEVIKVTNTDLK